MTFSGDSPILYPVFDQHEGRLSGRLLDGGLLSGLDDDERSNMAIRNWMVSPLDVRMLWDSARILLS